MTARPRTDAGVTLIETLVALFVIALMATAGAVMTGQSLRGARAVETRGDAATTLSTALAMVSADLAAYTGRPSQDATLTDPPFAFEGYPPRADGRLMVFVRNGWQNPAGAARSDLQRVEYLYTNGSLIRRAWAAPDPGPGTPSADQTLLTGLQRIDIRYGRGDTWQTEWRVRPDGQQPAPQKAELVFTFGDGDTLTARYLIGGGA
jgi:general secretion pathway protein J